jgi:hypothetical protein
VRDVQDVTEDLSCSEGSPDDLLDELFWSAMSRGLASGVAGWGRLFADIRGWSKSGGDNVKTEEVRITDADAAALVRAVLGSSD